MSKTWSTVPVMALECDLQMVNFLINSLCRSCSQPTEGTQACPPRDPLLDDKVGFH